MGPRAGTPMRLVSPAPVLVPPGPRPPQAPPSIYPPQPQATQQNMYSTQNNSNVGGKLVNILCKYSCDPAHFPHNPVKDLSN